MKSVITCVLLEESADRINKQNTRWSETGVHNLLQVQTSVLNSDLRSVFDR